MAIGSLFLGMIPLVELILPWNLFLSGIDSSSGLEDQLINYKPIFIKLCCGWGGGGGECDCVMNSKGGGGGKVCLWI